MLRLKAKTAMLIIDSAIFAFYRTVKEVACVELYSRQGGIDLHDPAGIYFADFCGESRFGVAVV